MLEKQCDRKGHVRANRHRKKIDRYTCVHVQIATNKKPNRNMRKKSVKEFAVWRDACEQLLSAVWGGLCVPSAHSTATRERKGCATTEETRQQ